MPAKVASLHRRPFGPLLYLMPPFAGTVFLWATSNNAPTLTQTLIALILLYVPWISFLQWKQHRTCKIPLFALISGMYWLYFGLALFWGDLRFTPAGARPQILPEAAITTTLLMVLLGVAAMAAGKRFGALSISTPAFRATPRPSASQWMYLEFLLVLGMAGTRIEGMGGDARQVVLLLVDFVPLVAFVLLFQKFLAGCAVSHEKLLLAVFLVAKTASGLATGWLGAVVGMFVIVGILYLQARGRIPGTWLLVLAVYVLFFQVGKEEFRARYWSHPAEGGTLERVIDWVGISLHQWQTLYDHPSTERFQSLVSRSVNRLSLLPMGAAVLERTPASVPHQHGKLYSYMLVTLIPRFLWPDKPSFNEANRFFQVAYGMSREQDLDRTSISVGVLVESYISFGWAGVLMIMFFMGVFFAIFQKLCLMPGSPILLSAIGIAMIPIFLSVESQLAQYLGGMIQQFAVAYCVLLPVTTRRAQRSASPGRLQDVLATPSR